MKNSTLKTLLVLSITLNLSFVAGALFYNHSKTASNHSGCAYGQGEYVFEKLNLNEDKKEKIRRLAEDFHSSLDVYGAEIALKNTELVKAISESNSPDGKTEQLINEISGKQKRIQMIIVEHLFEIKNELDAGQRRQFFGLIEETVKAKKGVY